MKNKELYHKTIDILVKAYLQETLQHGSCFACAVGNIVASNCGLRMSKGNVIWRDRFDNFDAPMWSSVFMTGLDGQRIRPNLYEGEAKEQIDSTGYTWQELAKIEHAFETANKGNNEDAYMFNGLMAVVEALDIIHENTDSELTTEIKAKFQKVNQ